MINKKRTMALLLSLIMVLTLGLAGCGGSGDAEGEAPAGEVYEFKIDFSWCFYIESTFYLVIYFVKLSSQLIHSLFDELSIAMYIDVKVSVKFENTFKNPCLFFYRRS